MTVITMRAINLLLKNASQKMIVQALARAAMDDVPMTNQVVQYGIWLGVLLPDYKCGWSKA